MFLLLPTRLSEGRGMMQKDKKYIAFVCTGNTCRSPMAEGIFNKIAQEKQLDIIAESFGLMAQSGAEVSRYSFIACEETGVDLSQLKSTSVDEVDLNKYEKFYCMSQGHTKILNEIFDVPINRIQTLDINDPYGGNIDVYRACCKQIYEAVCRIIKEYEN